MINSISPSDKLYQEQRHALLEEDPLSLKGFDAQELQIIRALRERYDHVRMDVHTLEEHCQDYTKELAYLMDVFVNKVSGLKVRTPLVYLS